MATIKKIVKKTIKKAQNGKETPFQTYTRATGRTDTLPSNDTRRSFGWDKGTPMRNAREAAFDATYGKDKRADDEERVPVTKESRKSLSEALSKVKKQKKGGMIKKKMKNGGSVAGGTKAPAKRVGPVDPKGAYTKVQERTLAGAKGKASLTKDKELGATKMKMGGVMKAEGGKWIQKAIKKPGALRAQLGAKPGKPIPAAKLAAAAKKPGKLGQRARLAQTLKKMKK